MKIDRLHVGYCTNVHPGESLAEMLEMLGRDVAVVKRRICPDEPFGLGLRLGDAAARVLSRPAALGALRARCDELGLYVFTVNAFPYGDFTEGRVKEAAYVPSWLEDERVAYTARVAEALVALPGPPERTISTVAGGFRPETGGPGAARAMARNLGRAARHLAELADRTGVVLRLCLEPEPWTTLETTPDAIAFFTEHLHPLGEHARAHLGICYDCCHQAVHFEDAAESLGRLAEAGIVVGKIQVSSALHLDEPRSPEARAMLLAFAEPRYLHQVVARGPGGALLRALDLPELVAPGSEWCEADAWRCHFHVPIGWEGHGPLRTTRADWVAAVRAAVAAGQCAHLEVETYTWGVIPEAERHRLDGGDVRVGIAAEIQALRDVLATG